MARPKSWHRGCSSEGASNGGYVVKQLIKKALITIYIAAVVFVSIVARAEEPAKVELLGAKYTLTPDLQSIQIQGRYPNVCTTGAQYNIAVEDNQVVVQVIANRPEGLCAAVLGGVYTLNVPLGAIKQQLPTLSLAADGTYDVVSGDRSFGVEVDFSKVQGAPGGFLNMKLLIQSHSSGTPAITLAY